jgi:hypothetical protein
MLRAPMVSATQQTSRIRARKAKKSGAATKRQNRKSGTPPFPVHPAGYDATAADAKKSPAAVAVKPPAAAAKKKKSPTGDKK